MRFLLGTHHPHWLGTAGVPLFVSHRTMRDRRTLPVAVAPWALDSGGFTELSMHGGWRTTPDEYVGAVRRYRDEIGLLEWAAPQDWMCEPFMLKRTGLTVADHQVRTVENFVTLRATAPDLPIVPVLQGWALDNYLRCVDLYGRHEVDLTREPIVGLGSVCRRQATGEVGTIVRRLHAEDISLHGFGVKVRGIGSYGPWLTSADSLAWSFDARRKPPLPGCTHKSCANCMRLALRWRERVLRSVDAPRLFNAAGEAA